MKAFIMSHAYVCKEYYEMKMDNESMKLPSDWKKTYRRTGLNVETENKKMNMHLHMCCLKNLYKAYKERHGLPFEEDTTVNMEGMDVGDMVLDESNTPNKEQDAFFTNIEKLVTHIVKKDGEVIAFVYDNTILYGDILYNTFTGMESSDRITMKLETMVDEMERILTLAEKNTVTIGYLRPNMEWLASSEKRVLEKATMDATLELLRKMCHKDTDAHTHDDCECCDHTH